MARVPTIAEEDAKRPNRERECLVGERTRIVNRIKSTLARVRIRNFKPTQRGPAPAKALGHAHISEPPSLPQESEFVDADFEGYGAGRSRGWISVPATEPSDQPRCPS